MSWLLRRARGPFWFAVNLLVACWRFNLKDMADRPGQTPVKRTLYRSILTVETLLEGAFLLLLLATVSASAIVFFPSRWVYLEIYDTWSAR